ncbi:ABC transporter B family member 15-like [Salvia miltiorrhiza]|uniref:ABC transporter B family member 15-like n=1 Tax=Salvia miltiorrhiza TaxID=226208 RepID=UPI0025AD1D37|nr:ABC transporter B family member 15-like [Salvia miltiorrhiza]
MGGLFRCADSVDKLFMLIGTVGCIGEGMASPVTMYVLSGALDAFGSADQSISNDVVNKYALRLLYVGVGVAFCGLLEGLCWTRTAERQTSRMRMEYLRSVLRQEVGFFDGEDVSSRTFQIVSSTSSDALTIQDVIANKIPNSLVQICSLVVGVAVALVLSWHLALASLPLVLSFIIPVLAFGKVMADIGIRSKDAYGVAGDIVEQAVSNVRTVYSYVAEAKTVARYNSALEESTELGIKQGLMKGYMIGSMGMMFATWAFQAWVGGLLVTEKGENGSRVFISGACIIIGGLSCINALPNVPYITEASAASRRIFEMINRVPEIDVEDENGKVLAAVKGQIEFREVHFSYPSRKDEAVLEGLCLKIRPGQKVGLVGGSGSGKSTVVSLLERFYDPTKGDILLDGHRIKKLQLKWYRSQFGLVSQEPVLFATSIKENVLFGKEDASLEEIVAAAKSANAHDFIVEFPRGYDTRVGQLGVQLSGGQRQRIAIARALLRNPRILLLDEATSALDAQSERLVQEAVDQAARGRTTLLIAHRLSTIQAVDTIMVLESGRIVESGSHDELLQTGSGEGGIYRRMMNLQTSSVNNELTSDETSHIPQRLMNSNSIKSFNGSSLQDSPVSPIAPTLPLSLLSSIQNSPVSSFSDPYGGDEKSDPLSPPDPPLWKLLHMNSPEWRRTLLGCLGAVGFGAVMPINAYCMGALVSAYFEVTPSKIKSETRFYCFVFLGLALVTLVSNILQHHNFAIMGERLTKRLREKILEKILTFEILWFEKETNTTAAICARLSTEANMVRSLVGDRMSLLVQVATNALLSFALGLIVAWRLAAVLISIQPVIITSFFLKTVMMRQMSIRAQEAQGEGSQRASEAVTLHRTITAFSSQGKILSLFEATLAGPRAQSLRQSWISGAGLCASQFLTTAGMALAFWYGGTLMGEGRLSSRQLFLTFFILMSTGKTIADAGAMSSDISKGRSAVSSVFAILAACEGGAQAPGAKLDDELEGKIEFDDVYFSYPSRPAQAILRGLSLRIEAGKTVALVGDSGCGKSTIVALIERFYDPIKGRVLIDGGDIRSYDVREMRSQIALVSQEPALFAGTIHENIIYGRDGATEAEIEEAAKLANAHEFISSMKDGYKTYCGDRGIQLSGGQKQRIALARAIIKNPKILLLDEATSALDSLSENLVQEALDKVMVARTSVVVAHRLSTVQIADAIAVVKDGKIVEEGAHEDLIAIGDAGFYYSLVKLQHHSLSTPH